MVEVLLRYLHGVSFPLSFHILSLVEELSLIYHTWTGLYKTNAAMFDTLSITANAARQFLMMVHILEAPRAVPFSLRSLGCVCS